MRIELTTEIDGKKVIGLEGIKQLADAGNIEALNLLGEWLLTGFECSPDVNYAFGCFEKAARGGNTQAMLNLGLCYIEGHGTAKNFYAAERWIRAADELGDEEAEGVCEELYLTSIGSHKPSLRALVDYMYSKHPKGNVAVDDELLKKEMMNYLILQEFGKSDEEIEALKGKVTENDIAAYESMNDLYYDDSSDSDVDTVFDRKQYVQNILANIEKHYSVPPTDNSRNKKPKIQRISVNLQERRNIATYIKLLYHLSKKNNKAMLKNLLAIGNECFSEIDFEDDLSWYERAMFDIVPDMLRTFSDAELNGCVSALGDYFNEIQTQELQNAFDENANDQSQLRLLQAQISKSSQYEKSVIDEWAKKISDRLYELDVVLLSKLFDEAGTDYEKLVGLHKRISDNTFEAKAKSEWLKKTADLLKTVQTDILEKICDTISELDYSALILLYEDTKNKYTFYRDILDKYLAIIAKPIDEHEISVLSKLCDNTDGLSSTEYEAIIKEIEKLKFKASNKQKYLDDISQKLKNAKVLESCEERYLEDYDLDQLNDRIKAIHFSTFPAEIKSELSQRITHYIDLIYECKDKKTVKLLSDCEPENIVNLSVAELSVAKNSLQEHLRLSPTTKEELVTRVEIQIRIKEFDKKFVAAGNDYDLLVAAKKALPAAKLPESEAKKYEALLHTKIIDAQRSALSELVAYASDENHAQICKRFEQANHFTYDSTLLKEASQKLVSRISEMEHSVLSNMCKNISEQNRDELLELKKAIEKFNYKKEIIKQYTEGIDKRLDDIHFIELTEKCSDNTLMALKTPEVVALCGELESYLNTDKNPSAYIARLKQYLDIRKAYDQDVKELYQSGKNDLIGYISSVVTNSLLPHTRECYKPEVYIQGASSLAEYRKADNCVKFYDDNIEYPVFYIFQLNGANKIPNVSITNLNMYLSKSSSDGKVVVVPLETITALKPARIFSSISVTTSTEAATIHSELPFAAKQYLTNTLSSIINRIVQYKAQVQSQLTVRTSHYKQDAQNCFNAYPVTVLKQTSTANLERTIIEAPKTVVPVSEPLLDKTEATSTSTVSSDGVNSVGRTTPAAQVGSTSNGSWLCSCGKINEGKFCSGCGTSREQGTPVWKCVCGNYNKGKFCPKCGNQKT